MAFKLLLLVSLTIALASPAERPEGKRLIKLKMGEPAKWMSPEEMKQMFSEIGDKAFGYLDLTRQGVDKTENSAQGRKLYQETYPAQPLQKDGVRKLITSLKKDRLEESVKTLSSFHNRHLGESFGPAERWLNDEIKSILANYSKGSSILHIPDRHPVGHDSHAYNQNNILVKLEGQDPDLKAELVILSAHYDTVIGFGEAGTELKRAPGADDNASCIAVLLEVLRILVHSGTKLKRTVEFHFYAAKEYLGFGSDNVAMKYRDENATVKGLLNLDRCGNGKTIGYVLNSHTNYWVTSGELTAFVKMLVEEYVERGFELKEVQCEYICFSDHTAWWGFPTAYLLEYDQTPHLHSESDTVETLNFELVNEFAKVALAYAVELGDPASSSVSAGWPQVGWTLVGLNSLCWIWLRF